MRKMTLTKMLSIATTLSPAFKFLTSAPVSITSPATSATVVPTETIKSKVYQEGRFSTPRVSKDIKEQTFTSKSHNRMMHHTLKNKAKNERSGNKSFIFLGATFSTQFYFTAR